MRSQSALALVAASLGLAACISATPLTLPDDHPANPKAASGLVGSPSALEDYKTENDFVARAAEDAKAPASAHAGHAGMSHGGGGMQHGGMTMSPTRGGTR
jgi:hypothetical protein